MLCLFFLQYCTDAIVGCMLVSVTKLLLLLVLLLGPPAVKLLLLLERQLLLLPQGELSSPHPGLADPAGKDPLLAARGGLSQVVKRQLLHRRGLLLLLPGCSAAELEPAIATPGCEPPGLPGCRGSVVGEETLLPVLLLLGGDHHLLGAAVLLGLLLALLVEGNAKR